MVEKVNFELYGVKEMKAKIATLNFDLQYKSGRFALRKAANFVRDQAIGEAFFIDDPDTARNISENIVVRFQTKRFKATGDVAFRVGVLGGARSQTKAARKRRARRGGELDRRGRTRSLEELGEIAGKGKGNPGGDTWYWRFIEFGTSRQRAQPFLTPALANNTGIATEIFAREFNKAIDRAAKREAKKFRND